MTDDTMKTLTAKLTILGARHVVHYFGDTQWDTRRPDAGEDEDLPVLLSVREVCGICGDAQVTCRHVDAPLQLHGGPTELHAALVESMEGESARATNRRYRERVDHYKERADYWREQYTRICRSKVAMEARLGWSALLVALLVFGAGFALSWRIHG